MKTNLGLMPLYVSEPSFAAQRRLRKSVGTGQSFSAPVMEAITKVGTALTLFLLFLGVAPALVLIAFFLLPLLPLAAILTCAGADNSIPQTPQSNRSSGTKGDPLPSPLVAVPTTS